VSTGETGAATRVAHRGGGLLQFSRTAYRVRETDQHATIRVERLGSLNGTVTVAYATSPGTALAGLNYQAAAGTLTFAEGVTAQRFMVQVQADGQVTGTKTVLLTLSAPTGGARLGPQRRAVLAIVNTDVALTGTAAAGAPLASRLIRIKDKNGARRTGTTDSGGKFTVAVTGLAPTFLVKVEPPGVSGLAGPAGQAVVLGRAGPPVATPLGLGSRAVLTPVTVLDPQTTALFSVGTAEAGVVNVHPFTDLIIRTWYEVQGTTVESVFDAPTTDPPAPSAEQVAVIASLVKDMLNIWLVAQGLAPITFDLIATPFDADGTGFDAVLEAAALEVNALTQTTTVTLTNPGTSVTQTTALTIVNQILKASTTATGAGSASSVSLSAGIVPTDPAIKAALDGVSQTVSALRAVVNSKGNSLRAADIQQLFDANYLNKGEVGPALGAANFVTNLRGQTLESVFVDRIVSYDDTAKVLCAVTTVTTTVNGTLVANLIDKGYPICFRQQPNQSWLFFGDQRIASDQVEAQIENRNGSGTGTKVLHLFATAPHLTVSSVTVTGTDGLSETLVLGTSPDFEVFKTYQPDPPPAPPLNIQRDGFVRPGFFADPVNGDNVNSFPAIGTVYTFTVTPVSGSPQSLTVTVQGTTVETISITSFTGHALSDAAAGTPLTVNWTLPKTFPILLVNLNGFANGGTAHCTVKSTVHNSLIPVTTGSITFPVQCAGNSVTSVQLVLTVTGTHGELTEADWIFQ
jgi:hypothetical protein